MIKKVIWMAGTLSTVMVLAAVGCSSSSSSTTGGGGADSGGGSEKDGSTSKSDGGFGGSDGGGGKKDSGTTTEEDSGTTEDSGTGTHLDAGADADAGPITLDDGGTVTAPACYDLGSAEYFPNATAALANQNKCNATQIAGYYTACLDTGATSTTCDAFVAANGACATCIQGPTSGSAPFAFPVLVPLGTDSVEVSYEACYAALSTGNAACKANVPNEAMCVDNACNTCTGGDVTTCGDYGYADSAGCSTVAPVDTTCLDAVNTAAGDATNQTKCGADAADFQGFYTAVATTMCGP